MRVLLLGATGNVGRAALRALVAEGHVVMAQVRPVTEPGTVTGGLRDVAVHAGGLTAPDLADAMWGAEAVVSCLGSRSRLPRDAWAVDHDAHATALAVALAAGVPRFVLLSAMAVQKPDLGFLRAKLAFETKLRAARIRWSIVRPTACFLPLTAQLDRLRAGKPFRVYGDGRGTAVKPISEDDLGRYLARCLDDPALQNRVLPIGGPGPALTPREICAELCRLLGRAPRFREIPLRLADWRVAGFAALGQVWSRMRDQTELARIGRYRARESGLLWDPVRQRYDARATPEYGRDTLFDHYARLVQAAEPRR